eukprot:GHRR01031985.1.p1 GENE.GHRR01031985.1~~GHRR01031985.1.p1  ORF type:complete len:119 (+),score=16.26 GHRR01031985.1:209-565(+)
MPDRRVGKSLLIMCLLHSTCAGCAAVLQQKGTMGLTSVPSGSAATGSLFFTDWAELDIKTRMKFWDRRFKVLISYPQVLITPHSAFLTHEALHNIAETTIQNMAEFLEGKPLTNVVKP